MIRSAMISTCHRQRALMGEEEGGEGVVGVEGVEGEVEEREEGEEQGAEAG